MTEECLICGNETDDVEEYVKKNTERVNLLETRACKKCRSYINKQVS